MIHNNLHLLRINEFFLWIKSFLLFNSYRLVIFKNIWFLFYSYLQNLSLFIFDNQRKSSCCLRLKSLSLFHRYTFIHTTKKYDIIKIIIMTLREVFVSYSFFVFFVWRQPWKSRCLNVHKKKISCRDICNTLCCTSFRRFY